MACYVSIFTIYIFLFYACKRKKKKQRKKKIAEKYLYCLSVLLNEVIEFGLGFSSPEAVFVVLRLSLAVVVSWETDAAISSSTVGEGRICFKESVCHTCLGFHHFRTVVVVRLFGLCLVLELILL